MMASKPRILIYSASDTIEVLDHAALISEGYNVTSLSQPQAIETWLNTFLDEVLLIIVHSSAHEGLKLATQTIAGHPLLPIILISTEVTVPALKQALEIGLVDYLTFPVTLSTVLASIQHAMARSKDWQEWRRFGYVFTELKDGLILTDISGSLLAINQAARDIFSVTDEQPVGKKVEEVFNHPDLLDTFASKHPLPHRKEITVEGHGVFSAQASLIPNVGIAVVFQDITHLKELDRIKTEFVNTVSHDLRSPLTAIYGFVGLLDRVGPINPQQAEFIRHIQSSVQHITSMINDLLELGRVEADYDIQMEDVDLREIVKRSVENLDYQTSEKMQEVNLSLEDTPIILANPIHLQRMVINLIDNAVKFTPPLGKITVRCKSEANQVILEVADSGPGIPIGDQPKVFDKFYRGSNLPENIPGTGLGLSIVKSIVDKHHGRIWLESSPSGTTFTVILPVK